MAIHALLMMYRASRPADDVDCLLNRPNQQDKGWPFQFCFGSTILILPKNTTEYVQKVG